MELFSALGARFTFAGRMLTIITEDFNGDEWSHRLHGLNSPHWVLGHVTVMRRVILRLIGQDAPKLPWEEVFNISASGAIPLEAPGFADLIEHFHSTTARIAAALEQLPPSEADREMAFSLPDGSRSVGQALLGLYMHESYHLGQLGLLRRLLDKPGIA